MLKHEGEEFIHYKQYLGLLPHAYSQAYSNIIAIPTQELITPEIPYTTNFSTKQVMFTNHGQWIGIVFGPRASNVRLEKRGNR